jgi:hypothetical protein
MEIFTNVLDQIKVPTANDNVYSEECVFSYDTPVNNFKSFFSNFRCVNVLLLLLIRKPIPDYT